MQTTWHEAKSLLEQVTAEKRVFTCAEQARWNAAMAELTALTLAATRPEPAARFERGGAWVHHRARPAAGRPGMSGTHLEEHLLDDEDLW